MINRWPRLHLSAHHDHEHGTDALIYDNRRRPAVVVEYMSRLARQGAAGFCF